MHETMGERMDSQRTPRISVSIVTYNSADKIGDLLYSLFAHSTRYPLTVYVVDNQSTDQTVDLVRARFPQVHVIENTQNLGFGHGHNRVLDLLDSDYHAIVNPDILLKDDALASLADYFEQHGDVVLACPKILNMDGTEQHLPRRRPKLRYLLGGRLENKGELFKRWRREYTMGDQELTDATDVEFITGCFMFIRTPVLKKVRGFDERYFMYFEDADLTRQSAAFGRTVILPQVSVIHMWERASAKKLKFFLIQIQSMLKYFGKWSFKRS